HRASLSARRQMDNSEDYNPFTNLLASQGQQPQAAEDSAASLSPYPEPPVAAQQQPASAAAYDQSFQAPMAAPRPDPSQEYMDEYYEEEDMVDYHYSEDASLSPANAGPQQPVPQHLMAQQPVPQQRVPQQHVPRQPTPQQSVPQQHVPQQRVS